MMSGYSDTAVRALGAARKIFALQALAALVLMQLSMPGNHWKLTQAWVMVSTRSRAIPSQPVSQLRSHRFPLRRTTMKASIFVILTIGSLMTAIGILAATEDEKQTAIQKDRKQYEGTWRVVSLEINSNKS